MHTTSSHFEIPACVLFGDIGLSFHSAACDHHLGHLIALVVYILVSPSFPITNCATAVVNASGKSGVPSNCIQYATSESNRPAPKDPHLNQGGLSISSPTIWRFLPVLSAPVTLPFLSVVLASRCAVAVSMVSTRVFMSFLAPSTSSTLFQSASSHASSRYRSIPESASRNCTILCRITVYCLQCPGSCFGPYPTPRRKHFDGNNFSFACDPLLPLATKTSLF